MLQDTARPPRPGLPCRKNNQSPEEGTGSSQTYDGWLQNCNSFVGTMEERPLTASLIVYSVCHKCGGTASKGERDERDRTPRLRPSRSAGLDRVGGRSSERSGGAD